MLRGVEVAAFQREAGQRAQMVDGEEMLAESQPPRIGIGGPGRIGGLSQAAGLEPGQRPRTRHHHELDRFGDVGCRQSRGCLALGRREVVQAGIHADEDQRDDGVPFVGELRPLLDGPGGQGRLHGLFQLAGHPVAERLKRREPGGQPRIGRDLPGVLKQVKVLTAASRITRQQQVGGQAQQAFRGFCQQRGVDHAQTSGAGTAGTCRKSGTTRSCRSASARSACCAAR